MPSLRGLAFGAAALVITAYGGLLRFEAMVADYGWMGLPAWSEALARHATPIARELRPVSVLWVPVKNPYAGSDPVNYLRFAREMTGFYQAHVREPLFLAISLALKTAVVTLVAGLAWAAYRAAPFLIYGEVLRADESGVHYSALPPEMPVAFRLWYVRLEPAGALVTTVQ